MTKKNKENSLVNTVYLDDYPVYEDERWLTSVDDIEDTASDIRHDYMSADSEGYNNFAEVLFKIGDKYYLVEMEAEVERTWMEYGDVYNIGKLMSCNYEQVHVIERTVNEYKGQFNFKGNVKDMNRITKELEKQGVYLTNIQID